MRHSLKEKFKELVPNQVPTEFAWLPTKLGGLDFGDIVIVTLNYHFKINDASEKTRMKIQRAFLKAIQKFPSFSTTALIRQQPTLIPTDDGVEVRVRIGFAPTEMDVAHLWACQHLNEIACEIEALYDVIEPRVR
jgi:hypothetical protein